MHVLIENGGATETREVADLDEAQALADTGHTVLVPNKDGGHRVLSATGDAPAVPTPIKTPAPAAKKVAPAKAAAKKTAAKKK